MTLEQFEKELREVAPDEFHPAFHEGLTIHISSGHFAVCYGADNWIGSADSESGKPPAWGAALDQAIAWFKANPLNLDFKACEK